MFRKLLPEELAKLPAMLGEAGYKAGRYEEAAKLFDEITTSENFVEFLTLPAYERID
jgi:malate synthase